MCLVCFWEDDGQDDEDANTNRIFSPNHMSLTLAKENYRRFRACEERSIQHVRSPLPAGNPDTHEPLPNDVAYERIKSAPGNMTPGSDTKTIGGFSLQTIQQEMRSEPFQQILARKARSASASASSLEITIYGPQLL